MTTHLAGSGFGNTNSANGSEENLFLSSLIGGLGGTLPTLCKIASASTANPEIVALSRGHITAMLLYFLIGFILCIGFQEKRRREAFTLGIAAPAIIISMLSGISERTEHLNIEKHVSFQFLSNAYADEIALENNGENKHNQSSFWIDFKRGLGFSGKTELIGQEVISLKLKNNEIEKSSDKLQQEIKQLIKSKADISQQYKEAQEQVEQLNNPTIKKSCPPCKEQLKYPSSLSLQNSNIYITFDYSAWATVEATNLLELAYHLDRLNPEKAKQINNIAATLISKNPEYPFKNKELNILFNQKISPLSCYGRVDHEIYSIYANTINQRDNSMTQAVKSSIVASKLLQIGKYIEDFCSPRRLSTSSYRYYQMSGYIYENLYSNVRP